MFKVLCLFYFIDFIEQTWNYFTQGLFESSLYRANDSNVTIRNSLSMVNDIYC